MSGNNISGLLPKFEEAKRPFRRLILRSNIFEGPLRPLHPDILLFDVSDNFLSGEIPIQNGTNLTLEALVLSNNRLTGRFPSFVCEIQTLTIIDLTNNRFLGELPDCIGNLNRLSMLDLTNNTFHGEVPNSITNLPLLSLSLHNNDFQGQIPSLENTMFNFSAMINVNDPREYLILDVDYGGSIPEIVNGIERRYTKTMPSLTSIDISRNRLHGKIPETLSD
ncbi:Leucine-rich repeat receptor protein kinase EMS1 [Striga hermonthica]|uniref:Leucine-rich repeat receptor protein kinase EMS1 n=1 Tax=Striga hermonthica TaxID=68872 RepID=A0A9N7MW34_STRHE|nr:Leucine-rich repeat receptor protein kinase EMS1 [Striga hermonthica]